MGQEPPRGPPVAQFPQRNVFNGIYGLHVTFPGQSPKLVVSEEEGGGRRLNTEMGHVITLVVRHTADHTTVMRFLLVFSKDSETSQPVHPCKNHQDLAHPWHMLVVEAGVGPPVWEEEPHPSLVVTPAPSDRGEYTVQLKFLCRNSCITRKDLTLVCQLERSGVVVGRDCLAVKISACPKRDANIQHRKHPHPQPQELPPSKHHRGAGEGHRDNAASTSMDTSLSDTGDSTDSITGRSTTDVADGAQQQDVGGGGVKEALEAARTTAHLVFMERTYKEQHPEDHQAAEAEFSQWWSTQAPT
ncbi:cellular tumor antigen p53-like [Homarus americanus]|nr:cellular tumor antigen p53-like [Homarus americanus]